MIHSENILQEIIEYISSTTSVDKEKLSKDVYDFITVFVSIKHFLAGILKKMKPKAVLIRCGYGRFPMALAQACREQGILPIEIQHGLITKYLIPYNRTTPTDNKDCIPEYLLTHGEIYADVVRNGNLFEKNKVIATGYPYLENTLRMRKTDPTLKHALSPFSHNILFTSQWIVASEMQEFMIKVAEQLENNNLDVGVLFKPHPYDKTDYADLHKKHKHLILIDKYEDIFKYFAIVDIHSTVYSTSGLEAMAFAVPNIFIDIYHLTSFPDSLYIVSSPTQFVDSVQQILSTYEKSSAENKEVANLFFTPSTEKNFKKFFTHIGVL
jgi:CDP-Glycerol:Poly(glycerophosphate) glycerophosphotransferase